MKTKLLLAYLNRMAPLLAVSALNAGSSAWAQGTSFTYQGRLTSGGSAASGSYDFRFRLASDPLGNNYVGGTILTNAVTVSNGLFTVALDFGGNVFSGADRWLQVDLRTNNGSSYTSLTPLQALTTAPYAIMATGASNLLGTLPAVQLSGTLASAQLSGIYSSAVAFNNTANTFSGSFSGSATGLTALNASALASGTVPDAQLAGNIARTNQIWLLGGNAGTTPGTHFLGTTDNRPLEFRVGNFRALRLEPGVDAREPNMIGGPTNNQVGSNVRAATIGGGYENKIQNFASYSQIGGGVFNTIEANTEYGAIGGGHRNIIGASSTAATIGGGYENTVVSNALVATIGGGNQNTIYQSGHATIAGGEQNIVEPLGDSATISGGRQNLIRSHSLGGTIGGGENNRIGAAEYATVGGGTFNTVLSNAHNATIGGGAGNAIQTNGVYAIIPGGEGNFAGTRAFAAGTRAWALHAGSFVWADARDTIFSSTGSNQFLIRAGGGVGIGLTNPLHRVHVGTTRGTNAFNTSTNAIVIEDGTENGRATFLALAGIGGSDTTNRVEVQIEAVESSRQGIIGTTSEHPVTLRVGNSDVMRLATNRFVGIGNSAPTERLHVTGNILATGTITPSSDRNAKTDIEAVDASAILERVTKLPIQQWRFKAEPEKVKHIGPLAQDFHAAFGLGAHDTAIATVDADGVALAAIQGLNRRLEQAVKEKEARISELERRLADLEKLVMNGRPRR